MNLKLKKTMMIGIPILMLGAGLGSGIGIGFAINQNNNVNTEMASKRQAIIDSRNKANMLISNYVKEYIRTPAYTERFTWKQEYETFFKSLYYPVDKSVDVEKQWYDGYGPLFQIDRSRHDGKYLIHQMGSDVYSYKWHQTDKTKPNMTLTYILAIWKCVNDNMYDDLTEMSITIQLNFPNDEF